MYWILILLCTCWAFLIQKSKAWNATPKFRVDTMLKCLVQGCLSISTVPGNTLKSEKNPKSERIPVSSTFGQWFSTYLTYQEHNCCHKHYRQTQEQLSPHFFSFTFRVRIWDPDTSKANSNLNYYTQNTFSQFSNNNKN